MRRPGLEPGFLPREVPPTAGLPLRVSELFGPLAADLAALAAQFLGVEEVGISASGSAALVLILQTLRRLRARRQVIVPAYTCPLVVLAVVQCGLQPVVCDVALGSFELDLDHLAALCGPDTLAVLPTHLGGRVARLDPVLAVARAAGAFVIEDAAQAFGARVQSQAHAQALVEAPEGTQSVGLAGDAGFFSFAAGKGLSLYEGGAWVARDAALRAEIAATARQLQTPAWGFEAWRILQLLGLALCYRPRMLPYVYGLPLRRAVRRGQLAQAVGDVFDLPIPLHPVGAWRRAVGARALRRLLAFQAALAQQAQRRLPQLARLPGVMVLGYAPADAAGGGTAGDGANQGLWPFFMLLLPTPAQRDAALAALWPRGIGVTRLFIHALPVYAYLRPWLPVQNCPHARDLAARMLTISNSPWLDDAGFACIMAELERCLR